MIILLATFIAGVIVGVLAYRNNVKKLQSTEDKGKQLLDALKKHNID
jgi:uncharacterized membrane-anchored protein YhcB (DUF1043 family)